MFPRGDIVFCTEDRPQRRSPIHRRPLPPGCAQLRGQHGAARRARRRQLPEGAVAAGRPATAGRAPSRRVRHPRGGHHGVERQDDGQGVALPAAVAPDDRHPLAQELQLAARRAAQRVAAQRADAGGTVRGGHQRARRDGRAARHHTAHHRRADLTGRRPSGELPLDGGEVHGEAAAVPRCQGHCLRFRRRCRQPLHPPLRLPWREDRMEPREHLRPPLYRIHHPTPITHQHPTPITHHPNHLPL